MIGVLIVIEILVHFLGQNQQDCQENDGIDIANVGARTTGICQNEKNKGNKG